ncbi:hypothetical protein FSOLCH5_011300 [Fusarium solani]
MAEAVGLAASVIAIIDLSAKVATLCLQYSTAVGNARADITHLQRRLNDLSPCLQRTQRLLNGPNKHALETSQSLVDCFDDCTQELARVQSRLDPGKARKAMRRFGLRALKWPLDSKEVNGIISNLDDYKQTIMLCLQVDQTTILLDIQQRFEGVSLQTCEDRSIARKPCFSVPFDRDPDFVDRPDIITWLEGQYTDSVGRMALVGMGGFGKSQVAIQFAHHIHNESPQTSVFWVHASSKLRFEEAYRSIAERLELPRRNDPDVDVLGLVRDWLQTEEAGSWMMVLDNADDANLFHPSANSRGLKAVDENIVAKSNQRPLAAYLPRCRYGKILVTSRSMDAAERLTGGHKAVYRISTMDDAQGLQLFRNKLNGDFDADAAGNLVRALDRIPLAIIQAAAYINRRAPRVSVITYLDTFRESDEKKGSLLDRDVGDLRRDETVSNSVITTWQVTFEQIRRERPSAANLLSFMSFFNPQGIPEFVLHGYDTGPTDNVDRDAQTGGFEDDLDVLRGYSLVSVETTRDVWAMHSLVQACTRAWLSVVDAARWKRVFLRAMSRHFPGGAFEAWSTSQMLLPHIESVLEEEPPDEDLQNWACLLTNCGWYMSAVGNYKAADNLTQKAVEARTKVLGEEHPDTLTSMGDLASTYRKQGRWKEAEELEVGVAKTRKRLLGEEHPDTLVSMGNLASTYLSQGRWKEAEELDVRVMKMMKRVLGEEHPHTLTSMSNLASTYWKQGRWKEAEKLDVRVAKTRKRVLGEEHPDTLASMGNLALTYWKHGRWKEAEELDVRVAKTRKRVLGEEHPDTLTSMSSLASTHWKQGRWKEAEELDVRVAKTRRRLFGEEHPDTLTSMSSLASTYRMQGRWKEAEELGVRVAKTSKRVLGEEHPDTLASMGDLALTYWKHGRWKEAEELAMGVAKTRKRVLGEEHPDTLTSTANLSSTYRKQGRWKEAEELDVRVAKTRRRLFGEEHPDTLTSMSSLASTYRMQGRWKEAEELEVGVAKTRKRVLGEEHPDTLTSMSSLASTYLSQGRWKEAEELEVGVAKTRKRVLGEEHPDTLTSTANLSSTYRKQGRWKEAEELDVRVAKTRRRLFGEEHPDTLTSMSSLASTYRMQGRWKEAEELEVGVAKTRKRVLGEEHPDTLTSMNNVAVTWNIEGRSADALALMRSCVVVRERVLGPDHPHTASSAALLAKWENMSVE